MKNQEQINLRRCGMIAIIAALAPIGSAALLFVFQDYNAARHYILSGIGGAGLLLGSSLIIADTVREYIQEENAARLREERPPITIGEVIRGPYDPQISQRNKETVARIASYCAFGFAVSALAGLLLDAHIATTITMLVFTTVATVIAIVAAFAADRV